MDNKTISSNSLGGFNNKTKICKYWKAYSKYDPVLECMDLGYYIAINLIDYKYTRSRGYGYAFSSGDDIGFGYGTCEEF